jgi:hypothetical protein
MIATETELAAYVAGQAAKRGLLAYHLDAARRRSNPSSKGFPDWVIAGPGGVLFRELKTQAGTLSDQQNLWLDILCAGGADARVWRPEDVNAGLVEAQLDAIAVLR